MKFDNVDLNLYKVFLAVAKYGSISKAANMLYVSQPAVSYSIKTLEKELDCKLFNRVSKGVELTADAKKLMFYVENAYNTILTGVRMLNDSTDLLTGEIRIGVPTHIGTFLVSNYIQKFSEQYPGIKFFIVNKSTNEMVEMLEKREIDIIIDTYPISSAREDITITELIEFENCFVGNEKYKNLSNSKKISIQKLQEFPLLLQPYRTSTRQIIEETVQEEINGLDALIEVPTTEVMLDLVKRGMGIGYFAKPSVLEELKNENLYEILVDIELPKTKVCMVYIKDYLTSAPKTFCKTMKDDIAMNTQIQKKSLRVIVTQNCIYNCEFCHKEGLYKKRDEKITAEHIATIYKIANKDLGISKVHLTGGEPIYRKDIYEIIKKLKEEGARVEITTNGQLLDENIKIGEMVDEINVSIHSLDKEKFEKLSKARGSYEKVINNIKLLRTKYPTLKVVINMTLMKDINNSNENIEKMIEFAKSLKVTLKIVELFPKTSSRFVSIEKITNKLFNMGFKTIDKGFRTNIFSNGKQTIILERCTCSVISEKKDKTILCKNNNDIYITPEGKISLCRYEKSEIDLMDDLEKTNFDGISKNLKLACERLGEECTL